MVEDGLFVPAFRFHSSRACASRHAHAFVTAVRCPERQAQVFHKSEGDTSIAAATGDESARAEAKGEGEVSIFNWD